MQQKKSILLAQAGALPETMFVTSQDPLAAEAQHEPSWEGKHVRQMDFPLPGALQLGCEPSIHPNLSQAANCQG